MTTLFWREIAGSATKLTNQVSLLKSNSRNGAATLEHRNRCPMPVHSFFLHLCHGNLRIFLPYCIKKTIEGRIIFWSGYKLVTKDFELVTGIKSKLICLILLVIGRNPYLISSPGSGQVLNERPWCVLECIWLHPAQVVRKYLTASYYSVSRQKSNFLEGMAKLRKYLTHLWLLRACSAFHITFVASIYHASHELFFFFFFCWLFRSKMNIIILNKMKSSCEGDKLLQQ